MTKLKSSIDEKLNQLFETLLLKDLAFLIKFQDNFSLPNFEKKYWIIEIKQSILICPETNFSLPKGQYLIEKTTLKINILTLLKNSTFAISPIILKAKDYEEHFDLFGIISRLKKYNKQLLSIEILNRIEEIEKLLTTNPEQEKNILHKTILNNSIKELPKITFKPTDKINYPLDKPNSIIWDIDTAKVGEDGQMRLAINTSKKGSKQEAIVAYSINFDELEADVKITKQLTPFDKRCYIAATALYNAGNKVITATQVYIAMGNIGKPRVSDLQKINGSITKMGAARVYIDNTREIQVTKGYLQFKYDAPLLPFARYGAYINGKMTENAIHLFCEPPLISFARQRKQITTIPRQLLESPINKTEANLRIDDYLLERIGRMKNGKKKVPRKMLFITIYKQCKITTTKQKQRAPEKICCYLDHYKKCRWIKGYIKEADGITIQL